MSDLIACEALATKAELQELRDDINKLLGAKQKEEIFDLSNYNNAVKQLVELAPEQYQTILSSAWQTVKDFDNQNFDYQVESSYEEVLGQSKFPPNTVLFNAIELSNRAIQEIEEIDDNVPNLNDALQDLLDEGIDTNDRRARGNRRFSLVSGVSNSQINNQVKKQSVNLSKLGKTTSKSSINLGKTVGKQVKASNLNLGLIFDVYEAVLETANTFVIDARLSGYERELTGLGNQFDRTHELIGNNGNNLKKVEKQFKTDKGKLEKQISDVANLNRDLEIRVSRLERIQKKILDRLPEINELKTELGTLKSEFESYQTQTDETLTEVKEQIEQLETTTQDIQDRQAELQTQVDDLQKQINELRNRVTALEKGQQELTTKLDDNFNKFLEFKKLIEQKVNFNKKEIEKLDLELEELDGDLNDLNTQLNSLGEYVPTATSLQRRAKIKALEKELYTEVPNSKPYVKKKIRNGKVIEQKTYKKVIKNGRVIEIEITKDPLDWYYDLLDKDLDLEHQIQVEKRENEKQQKELEKLEKEKVDESTLKKCLREELIDHPEHGSKKDKQDLIDNMPVFPELWNIRKEQIQDQLIVIYRNLDTESKSGNYSLVIPHYDGTRKPKFTPYKKGNHWGRFILKDNSTIIVNCISQNEAKRMINELKKYVKRQYLTDNISYGVYPKSHIKQITVKPLRADYYENRSKEQKQTPTWREYFNGDK